MVLLAKSQVTWDGHAIPFTKGSKNERPVLSAAIMMQQGVEKRPKKTSQHLQPISIILCKSRVK